MINDVSKLFSVSVWLTKNLKDYLLFVVYRDLKNFFPREGINAGNDLVRSVISTVEQVKKEGEWVSYLVCWEYDRQLFFQSDNCFYSSITSNSKLIETKVRLFQNELFNSLTSREKQIFRLLADGLQQDAICKLLKIKLPTLKCHRNHLYNKMDFSSKTDLLIWSGNYRDLLYSESV